MVQSFLVDCTSLNNARAVAQNQSFGHDAGCAISGEKLRAFLRPGLYCLPI